jgi:hypothetical protein
MKDQKNNVHTKMHPTGIQKLIVRKNITILDK